MSLEISVHLKDGDVRVNERWFELTMVERLIGCWALLETEVVLFLIWSS